MSTLIRNVGILDARKATMEQIDEITKIGNVGTILVSSEMKQSFMNVNIGNVGSITELDNDYKLQLGQFKMTRDMLEEAETGIKLCIVGQLTVDADIPPELMREKLAGIFIMGQVSVPENLHGILMSTAKEVSGQVSVYPVGGKNLTGKVRFTENFLSSLEDATDLVVLGSVEIPEDLNAELFALKIKSLNVLGKIDVFSRHETMARRVIVDNPACKVKIIQSDYHYVSAGTRLDEFTLMTITKKVISSTGHLILNPDITPELINEKGVSFDAKGYVYFPNSLMKKMSTRLTAGTKGAPYNPELLVVITEEQTITAARLAAMADNSHLAVFGELKMDNEISAEQVGIKIGILDNFGEINASKDVASILQSKLRHNEGCIEAEHAPETDAAEDDSVYDHIIENAGTYTL